MPLPTSIDIDKITDHTLSDVGRALNDWIKGSPRSEEAFLNHLTGILARRRRGCDIGLKSPTTAEVHTYNLHRKGEHQTDKYGADLAVTIILENGKNIKTVFFQLKKSQNFIAQIERSQINEANLDSRTQEKSFVLALDETRSSFRIQHIGEVEKEFNDTQSSKKVDTSDWTALTIWLIDWFSCKTGPKSDPKDPNGIEPLLEEFAVLDDWSSPWARREPGTNLGVYEENILPAKNWMIADLKQVESDKS